MQQIDINDDLGLPTELVLLIVSFADPQTLGRCAQLSFELLKFVSPFLYTRVALKNAESYGQLFCERDPTTSHPRLHPFLSLDQIQHLHFHIDSSSPPLMFPHRISSSPLRLQSLELTYRSLSPRGRHHDIYSQLLPSTLIFSRPSTATRPDDVPLSKGEQLWPRSISVGPHCMAAMVRSWKDVPKVVLAGAMPVRSSREDPILFHSVNDDREPPDGGMVVSIDISQQWYDLPKAHYIALGMGLTMLGSPVGGTEWRVIVMVRTEEEGQMIEEGRDTLHEEMGRMLKVEVVDQRRRVPMKEEE